MNNLIKVGLAVFICLSGSCSSNHLCKSRSYLKKIDTSKPFKVEGTYCISGIADLDRSESLVRLNVYDRISGKKIDEGTVYFSDTLKTSISSGIAEMRLSSGVYNVGITAMNTLPFSIKNLKVAEGQSMEINCYLGSSLQF